MITAILDKAYTLAHRIAEAERSHDLLGLLRTWLAIGVVMAPIFAAAGYYDHNWREALTREGVATTAEVKRLSMYRQFHSADIVWRDGAVIRSAKVNVSSGYADRLRTAAKRTAPIRHRGAAVMITDDAAENALSANRIRPALAVAFLCLVGFLLLRRLRRAPAQSPHL